MEHSKHSSPPRGMPAEAPRPRRGILHGRQKPGAPLAQQQPVTDEEPVEKKPSRLRLIRHALPGVVLRGFLSGRNRCPGLVLRVLRLIFFFCHSQMVFEWFINAV